MKIIFDFYFTVGRIANAIATYCNEKADEIYYKREAIAEEEYNKLVTDFYENGIGYYGEHHK